METQGKSSVFAMKAVETQGKGGVFATRAVETQGEGTTTIRCGARRRIRACFLCAGSSSSLA